MSETSSSPESRNEQRPNELADLDLLKAVKRGDAGAFDRFVERYGTRVMAFGRRMCGHREDAEDVYQETLLKAFQGLDRLREPRALRTWLFRVVATQCLMTRRKVPPAREVSLDEVVEDNWRGVRLEELPPCHNLPLEAAQRSELRSRLADAVQTLTPETRIVFLLRDVEGLSTSETAEVLSIGESAVKMRLKRARQSLRDRLTAAFGLASPSDL